MSKKVIGRIDKADFPTLDLFDIDIKIDTGAYTSSIHCDQIVEEKGVLKCTFLDEEHPNYNGRTFRFSDYDIVFVKSSNGVVQKRYQIQTTITLFGKTRKISLSLSARQEMRFPVLLGRRFITRKFIVDTELYDLSFKKKTE